MARPRALPGGGSSIGLRIGLLVDSLALEAWAWTMLRRLAASHYAQIALVVLMEPPARSPAPHARSLLRPFLDAAYERWEARYPCTPDAFERRDARPLLEDVPLLRAQLRRDASPALSAADFAAIRGARLDVLLDLCRRPSGPELSGAAKHGLWGLQHGEARRGFGTPPGLWETYFRVPVSATSVYAYDAATGVRRTLRQVYSATHFHTTRRNNNARYWKAASLLPRELERLWRDGGPRLREGGADELSAPAGRTPRRYGTPSDAQLAGLLAGRFARALSERAKEVVTLPQWILLFDLADRPASHVSHFRPIVPPRDRFWADPHVVERDGKYYVFFEEFVYSAGRGHISVLSIDAAGRCGAPVRVLERPYHLSYPSLLEHEGALYMIPESADNKTVELYRCVEFPHRWAFVGNLMEGIAAFDATLVRWQGRWWLFANVVENHGASSWDELFLFHSDALVGGIWTPHPLNPIVSDVRRARPAGAIIERDGALYRPSQDCAVRYGHAVRLNRITALSETEYEEVDAGAIAPDGRRGIIGVHTYARAGRLTVLDALRPRLRWH